MIVTGPRANLTWRSQAKRCASCPWYFSYRVEHKGRARCLACTSKLGELRLRDRAHVDRPAPPPAPPVRFGAKARLEDELRQAVENTARMQRDNEEQTQ